ncbi:MAG: elongation factor G, partial [Dehalococcoidales bacterium]|nr:elongation factor G [Dehalococcoidales bacterium]
MKEYGLDNLRNTVLLSHAGAGKTSLSEAILFSSKAINRLGKVDDGTTTSDYEPEEIKHKISLNLTVLPCEWNETKINLLDTPGYSDFVSEVKAGIRVSEGAIIVVCAASGVEVGTEQSWTYSEDAKLTRLIFVNKMDRENADFYRTVEALQSKFGSKCVPLQLPIGAQNDFQGVVDLLSMKSYTGSPAKAGDIPSSLQAQAKSFREKLVEAIAEVDDKLLEKYLGSEELSPKELSDGLRKGVVTGKIVPVLVGSATKNMGTDLLLDAVCSYLPSPKERGVVVLRDSNKQETIETTLDAPLTALVFKTSADPYVGKLTYFRVYNGTIASNSQVWNSTRGEAERIGQLFIPRGKTQETVSQIKAGDIGAVAKLSLTSTGDTLSSREKPIKVPPISSPEPIFSEAVYPKTKADLDKLGASLARLTEEDPALRIHRDTDTYETILSGLGETQLEVAAERMQRKFGVGIELKTPKVPYKETITMPTKAEYRHKKQSGGHGQFGHVLLELEPLPRGTGHEFVDKVVGGAIPRNFIPAVEKGVNEAVQEGILIGNPVTDIRISVYDGSYHPVDSSDICFKIAGAGALKKGLAQGQPVILEPIMDITVRVPEDYTGDIIGDLNTKRAQLQGMNPENGANIIQAQVPLAEILRYAIDLKSITQGRGSYTAKFSHYQETPAHVAQKIIAEKQA